MALEDEIDGLYRLTPDAFTAARNELAKRAGVKSAEVKRLAKPNAAAWAVNQLYWRRRPVFDALARASEARRIAHVKQLAGSDSDRERADARHRVALEAALDAALAFLRDAGDAASAATIAALTATLEAVPSPDIQGRLVRPLESIGFSMLASLVGPGGLPSRKPAEVVVLKRAVSSSSQRTPHRGSDAKVSKEAAAERRRQLDLIRKELAAAEARERAADRAHARARAKVDDGSRQVRELEDRLGEARRAVEEGRDELERLRTELNDATRARLAVERRMVETK
jgi:hypothetical protein